MSQVKHSYSKREKRGIRRSLIKVWSEDSAEQTWNLVIPCPAPGASCGAMWAPKDLNSSFPYSIAACIPQLSRGVSSHCQCLLSADYHVPGISKFLASPLYFDITVLDSHTAILGVHHQIFKAFFWSWLKVSNPGCMPGKPAPHE